MQLHEITKQIKSLNDRILELEKITANSIPDVIAARFKRPQAIVKGDVYVVADTGNQRIAGTELKNDLRQVVVALESSVDLIGTGQSWALCAISGLVWVNYVGTPAPEIGDHIITSETAGKATFANSNRNGVFGRIIRVDESNLRVFIIMSER